MEFHRVNSDNSSDIEFLYNLLGEREEYESISHKIMPTMREHIEFVKSNPYIVWFIIKEHSIPVGSCYVSRNYEVGISILKKHRKKGYAVKGIEYLKFLYPNNKLLANVNPSNEKSVKLFEKMGFKHIQNTYST